MPEFIKSTSNPRIQEIVKLKGNHKERYNRNLFVIEGYREISRAVISGVTLKEIYYCAQLDNEERRKEIYCLQPHVQLFEVSEAAFARIAYREGSDGLIALAVPGFLTFAEVKLTENPLILVIESVEKPGNLGAILRTADASGIDVVVVCDPLTDIYNPNVIRSSVGCVFSKQIVVCKSSEAISWLKRNQISFYAAALTEKAIIYHKPDYCKPTAFIMGTEATGLSKIWLDASDCQVIIPMRGLADSLNVSTSAAILAFEAVRQREMR